MGETGAPPVHVKLLVEGEEETGSPHLADVLRAHADQLRADLVVLSDTMTWAADRPAVCTGMRGMMAARLEIRAAQADVHGGAVAGAAVNPAHELARVVAGLHDATGRVSVPGFYDDVEEASDAERAALARLTADENDWLRRVGVRAVHGERGRSLGELLFTRPALEVRTLVSGDVQPPTTGTVSATAAADIQVSLVPRQDPGAVRKQLEAWFAQHVSRDVEFEFSVDETISQPAYVTPSGHPVLALIGEAMSQVWGCDVGRMRNAGGGPAAVLARASGAPVAFFGTGLPEDGWHGPDESVDLDVLLKGAATLALLWPRLAEQLPRRG
jgi:acetylornithine deacetylase/succinyl-diaminopimelate desuccinylase-like protein